MVERVRTLWLFFANFLAARKRWSWPRQASVLIFDACNQDVLLEDLQRWSPEVLHVRREEFNMRVLLASLFRPGDKTDAYIDVYIEKVRPRLVITFIDNNVRFLTVSRRHAGVKTLLIQNGWKSYYADVFELLDRIAPARRSALHVDYMLAFGTVSGAEYARHIAGTVVPMGSIKNNRVRPQHRVERGVIAFVSQWHDAGLHMNGTFYSQERFFAGTDRPLLQCLATYAKRNGKRLAIIPRYPEGAVERPRELRYFRELMGGETQFLEPHGPYASYHAIDAAEVVVAVDTTLAYEAIARGKRTAVFSVRGSVLGVPGLSYGWPGEFAEFGPFWANSIDPEKFERILDYLFTADDTRWRRDVEASGFSSLMVYDQGNTIFKSLLETELGAAAAPAAKPTRVHGADVAVGL